jgi:hypothetical protein
MPRLRHGPDRCARWVCRKTTPIHELERYMRCKGLFAGARLCVQAVSLGSPATPEDFSERPAVNLVAGRTVRAASMRADQIGAQMGLHLGTARSLMGSLRTFGSCIANMAGDKFTSAFRRHTGRDQNCCWLGSVANDPMPTPWKHCCNWSWQSLVLMIACSLSALDLPSAPQ